MSKRRIGRRTGFATLTAGLTVMYSLPAMAGPPYQSDDPQPTDYGHYEIYTFNKGARSKGDLSGASGIDFNYGAAPDLFVRMAARSREIIAIAQSDFTGVGHRKISEFLSGTLRAPLDIQRNGKEATSSIRISPA